MNNKLAKYIIMVVIAFAIDSTIFYFLKHDTKGITIIPYIGLMLWTLLNNEIIDDDRYIFASSVGAYYAIVYANSLLIYLLLYGIYAFFGRRYMKLSKFTLFEAMIVIVLTIFVQEVVIYWLMWITNVTAISFMHFSLYRLLPTLLCNTILSIPLYYLHKKIGHEGKKNAY